MNSLFSGLKTSSYRASECRILHRNFQKKEVQASKLLNRFAGPWSTPRDTFVYETEQDKLNITFTSPFRLVPTRVIVKPCYQWSNSNSLNEY